MLWRRRVEPAVLGSHTEACRTCSQIQHDVRNAVLGIHHERQVVKRALTVFVRAYIDSYDRVARHMERIELVLAHGDGRSNDESEPS